MRLDLPAYLLVQRRTTASVGLVSERISDDARAALEEVKGGVDNFG